MTSGLKNEIDNALTGKFLVDISFLPKSLTSANRYISFN